MAHPQNSPRGLHAKNRYEMGPDGVFGTPYSDNTAVIDANSTGPVLAGQLTFVDAASSLPGDLDGGVALKLISNSTGVAVGVNTTGTTWKFLNVTTAQPT